MSKRFPKFSKVEEAKCFACEAPVRASTVVDDGYARGRGQWRAACSKCGKFTWFDLKRAA